MLKIKIVSFLISFFFCTFITDAQKKPVETGSTNRIEKVINSQWTFNYFPSASADEGYEAPGFNDSRWPAISLPHTWNTFETTGEFYPFLINPIGDDNIDWWIGWGWYRKRFTLKGDYSNRKVFIRFERVQKYCKVWFNGKYLGENNNGNIPFFFEITNKLKADGENVLAVAVNNKQKADFKYTENGEDNFNLLGGISGNVSIVIKDKLYIPLEGAIKYKGGTLITTPLVSVKEGNVRIQTWVKNDNPEKRKCTLQTSILDANQKVVSVIKSDAVINHGQLFKFDQTTKPIKNPHLWSKEDPYIYRVFSELFDGKAIVDTYSSSQSLKFSSNGDTAKTLSEPGNMNIFKEIFLDNTKGNSAYKPKGTSSGEPTKIVLKCSYQKIPADRGSIAIITADIVDSQGNHINSARNILKWSVTGPAKIIGPSIYESGINKNKEPVGDWYKGLPVSNIIRSTGEPGRIRITVFASGVASGSIELLAEEILTHNSVIVEPVLKDDGRRLVAGISLISNRLEDVPAEIKMTSEELKLSSANKQGFAKQMKDYIRKNNPSVDTSQIEIKTLVDLFASQLMNNDGHLSADDYNYNIDHYNNCRLIDGYINSTKLPQQFKDELRMYYATALIKQGSEKDAGDEMNWLNWIPSGGTVVIYQDRPDVNNVKGVMITDKSNLAEIIALVYPGFVKFGDVARERALTFISKMNPYIYLSNNVPLKSEGDNQGNKTVLYKAEKGKIILIPLLKFIAE